MSNKSIVSFKDSIATKLMKAVISVYLLFMVVTTAFHMFAEYQRIEDRIYQELYSFQDIFGPALMESIWDFDEQQVGTLLSGMIQSPTVVGIKIEKPDTGMILQAIGKVTVDNRNESSILKNETVEIVEESAGIFSGLFWHSFPLFFEGEHLGVVTLYSSKSIIMEQVRIVFMLISVNAIVTSIALWVIFIWFTRRILIRPLTVLTEGARQLSLDNLKHIKIETNVSDPNEVKVLEEAFNTMLHNLLRSKMQLDTLLDSAKELTTSRDHKAAVLSAAKSILRGIPVRRSAGVHITLDRGLGKKEKFAHYRMKYSDLSGNVNIGRRLKSRTVQIHYSNDLPTETSRALTKGSRVGCQFFENILIVPVWRGNDFIGSIEIEDIQGDLFGTGEKNFMDTLAHYLQIALENIDINQNLEEQVRQRTAELQKTLQALQAMKHQQDGDYFLTSLLIKPLAANLAQSESMDVEFFVKQKKNFKFKHWNEEIGGDICLSASLQLQGESHTVFINADAMGKSIQGAGGGLVLGAVFRSIVERTRFSSVFQGFGPEQWLKYTVLELHHVFESFDGSMLITAALGLVNDRSGLMHYLNAEHPWTILYRNKQAVFLEEEAMFYKLGTSGIAVDETLSLKTFQLEPGDVVIAGSDGRDDVMISNINDRVVINDNETLILGCVEEGNGELPEIYEAIIRRGELTDDISLLRLAYTGLPKPHVAAKSVKSVKSNKAGVSKRK